MEVIKNESPETIQEEKLEPMSEFCEELMEATGNLKHLMGSEDCALVI